MAREEDKCFMDTSGVLTTEELAEQEDVRPDWEERQPWCKSDGLTNEEIAEQAELLPPNEDYLL